MIQLGLFAFLSTQAMGAAPIPIGQYKPVLELGPKCQRGDMQACGDVQPLLVPFAAACEGDDGAACAVLSLAHENGWFSVPDKSKSTPLMQKACRLGEATACEVLLTVAIYDKLGQGGEAMAPEMADVVKTTLESSCARLGSASSPLQGLTSMGQPGAQSCYALAGAAQYGIWSESDLVESGLLVKRACDGEHPMACVGYADLLVEGRGITKDVDTAFKIYEKVCGAGEIYGCLGVAIGYRDGLGVTQDPQRAFEILSMGCQRNSGEMCFTLSVLLQRDPTDEAQTMSARARERACQLGVREGCAKSE